MRHVLWEGAGPGEVAALATDLERVEPSTRLIRVRNEDDAMVAVLAAISGAGLVVDATAPRAVIDHLYDDLRALDEVDHRVGPAPASALSRDQRLLLAELMAGRTLGEAAARLHLSRRTADRRLAAARTVLGAGSTPEALRLAAALGVVPSDG